MNRKTLGVLAFAAIAALILFMFFRRSTPTTSGDTARQLVADGALLVDVRSGGEFSQGHIEGAINIPVQSVMSRFDEFGEKDKAIVVYCQSGGRSAAAKRMLVTAGYKNVHNLGAMSSW